MSGLAGIFNRDARPIEGALLGRMLEVVSHRGPDGHALWIDGPIGLGHLQLATTPDSVGERQPVVDATSRCAVIFDGRLDDRARLSADLVSRGCPRRDRSDAELVLAAFTCWGDACFERLQGDFALAVWDGGRRRLVCARDIMGVKPFYYAVFPGGFVFGSQMAQVLLHPGVPARPNEGMIAETLAVASTSTGETLYRDVFRLPPAHALIVDESSIAVRRYWSIEPERSIRYRRHEEYVEHFLEIFKTAVSDRARCHGRLGATLSGGLDSSAVVAMAQTLLRESGSKVPLATFSHTFPGMPMDETPYIECVAREWGVESRLYPMSIVPAPWADQARRARDLPDHPFLSASESMLAGASGAGVRVLLSGMGSDTWIGGSPYSYPDLLRRGNWRRISDELRLQTRRYGGAYATKLLLRSLLWPVLPGPLRKRVELRRSRGEKLMFLTPSFVDRTSLLRRVHRNDCAEHFRSLAKMETYRHGTMGASVAGLESADRANAEHGLEERHPFLDRRLAEFAMAIPDAELRQAEESKLLLRRAPGLLPPLVRSRLDGGEFSIWLKRTLGLPEVSSAFSSLAIADEGWVDPKAVTASHQRALDLSARGLAGHEGELLALWMVFAVETWYRHGLPQPADALAWPGGGSLR